MFKFTTLIILIISILSGCLSLDPFLYSEEGLSEYKMYDYTGEMECSDAIEFLDDNGYERAYTKEYSFKSGKETIYAILANTDSLISSSDTVILYLHGTSNHIDFVWTRVALLAATDYPIFAIDYKGYGKSEGEPTEQGLNEDGYSALKFIRDSLGVNNIIVYAYSLGSLIGCEIAANDSNLLTLVLETPIGSVETLVQDASYLNLPGSYATTFTGNNIKRIKNVTMPLFWMHGDEDETLYIETNGKPIWENHPGEVGYCIRVKGAGHTDIPKIIGYGRYIEILKDFFQNRDPKDPLMISK